MEPCFAAFIKQAVDTNRELIHWKNTTPQNKTDNRLNPNHKQLRKVRTSIKIKNWVQWSH